MNSRHELSSPSQETFKAGSLEQLKKSLAARSFPGYPETRWHDTAANPEIPEGPWNTVTTGPLPPLSEQQVLQDKGLELDSMGRPLHPWFYDMVTDPGLGVVAGRGFYWNWGPNYTADPIVFRHDLEEIHVLLVSRKDTGQLALPGGFIDENEEPLVAAIREAREEALIDLASLNPSVAEVYSGTVADIRSTAHAWAETTAVRFDLPTDMTDRTPTEKYKGGDDAESAQWIPISKMSECLFGSHLMLIELALEQQQV